MATQKQKQKREKQRLYVHTHCPQCGSEMGYEGGSQKKLKCRSCNYSRALNRNTDQVVNQPLHQGVKLKDFVKGMGLPMKAYTCENEKCKAQIAIYEKSTLSTCPFCTSDKLTPTNRDKEVFRPFSMIPFTISQDYALKELKSWLRKSSLGRRFFPNDIFGLLEPPKMRGVYIPLFLYDALTRSTWAGEKGFKYKEEKKGKQNNRTSWEGTKGYYEHFFENFDILVSEGTDLANLDDVMPFNFKDLVPYDTRFLEDDWTVELYQLPEITGFKAANEDMDAEIKEATLRRIKADDIRKLKITSEKLSIAFKHILVPLWIGSYKYEKKVYQFMINGQTGEISGEKPLATLKLYIAVAAVVALIIVLVLLFSW